jgi:hypothetical protein
MIDNNVRFLFLRRRIALPAVACLRGIGQDGCHSRICSSRRRPQQKIPSIDHHNRFLTWLFVPMNLR